MDCVDTMGFSYNISDQYLFIYHHGNDTTYILLYMGENIIVASFDVFLQSIILKLSFEFSFSTKN